MDSLYLICALFCEVLDFRDVCNNWNDLHGHSRSLVIHSNCASVLYRYCNTSTCLWDWSSRDCEWPWNVLQFKYSGRGDFLNLYPVFVEIFALPQESFQYPINIRRSLKVIGNDSVNDLKHICFPYSTVTGVLIDCMSTSFLFYYVFIFTILAVYFSIVHYTLITGGVAPVEWRHIKLWRYDISAALRGDKGAAALGPGFFGGPQLVGVENFNSSDWFTLQFGIVLGRSVTAWWSQKAVSQLAGYRSVRGRHWHNTRALTSLNAALAFAMSYLLYAIFLSVLRSTYVRFL